MPSASGKQSPPTVGVYVVCTVVHVSNRALSVKSRLVLISPYDVIGEVRQPNLPGTVEQYPNWRLPLPETLEELRDDPRVRVVVDELRLARPRSNA